MTSPAPHALVTGGAGFIGSHLVDHLLAGGGRVTVVDDLSTGRRANLDAAFAAAPDRLAFIEAPLPDCMDRLEAIGRVDTVFHLAAAVGVQRVIEAPIESIETNITPTAAILGWAAARDPMPRVLLASSSEVYGKSADLPFREDGDCVFGPTSAPRWSYAASKAIDEYLALAYHTHRGLPAVAARLFNTVGPRQVGRYGMVLPRFVRAALDGEPLRVFGDGEQTRCFCDVRDVAPALAELAQSGGAFGRVFNVGSDREISIKNLAGLVIETVGSGSSIEMVPYDAAYGRGFEDPRARRPDLTRLRGVIGFEPSFTLERTIKDIAADIAAPMRTQ